MLCVVNMNSINYTDNLMHNTFGKNIILLNEQQRLEALRRYEILGTEAEASFQHIAQLIADVFQASIAMISLVDADEVHFKSSIGMGNSAGPRGESFCSLTVLEPKVNVIEDALEDPVVINNPLVQGEFGLRFYAGAPLITSDGFMIGTVCLVDTKPRKFSEQQKNILADIARIVMQQIELREANLKIQKEKDRFINNMHISQQNIRNMVRQAPVGMCIVSGDPLYVEEVNAFFLEIIGKKREPFYTMPYWEVNAEARALYEPITTHVMQSGETFHAKEHEIMLIRNGTPEVIFVDFVYEPMRNTEGAISGIIIVATEVTDKVLARKILQDSNEEIAASNEELAAGNEELTATNEELAEAQHLLEIKISELANSEARFRRLIQETPAAIFVLKGRELIFETVNNLMYRMLGKTSDIIGKAYAEAVPELIGQPFFNILDQIFVTGQPFYGNEIKGTLEVDGKPTDGYFNFVYQPLKNELGEVNGIICLAIDVIEQVKSRKIVERAEESLRIATESGELGTWYYRNDTGRFETSSRFRQIFGLPPATQSTYEDAFARIRQDHQSIVAEAVSASISSGLPFKIEYPVIAEDNKERWVRSVGKMVADEDGGSYITGVLADITEQQINEMRKNDFIGMVSHELKTPLTSLNAYIQMLEAKAKKSEDTFTANALGQARKQVAKMTTMINGFLNVSRLESGQIQIDKQPFDMAGLVKEVEEEAIATLTSHHIIFEPVELTPVFADRDKIGQVINNFLSNAVKYSPNGSTIHVACITKQGQAEVSVADEGVGISIEQTEKLFDRYYRVENPNTKHISGFGIGLYLCKEIIMRHDGLIWAINKPDKGSIFYFTLPVIV